MAERKIRVLVAKPGLDGHDRGAKVIAASLRDAGMEVIYTGLHQTPEKIAATALQEDVDVVALSILSGAHMTLFPRVLNLLRENDMDDVLITGGGIIPQEDVEALQALGIGRLFGPGTATGDAAGYIQEWFLANTARTTTSDGRTVPDADDGGRGSCARRPTARGWRYEADRAPALARQAHRPGDGSILLIDPGRRVPGDRPSPGATTSTTGRRPAWVW